MRRAGRGSWRLITGTNRVRCCAAPAHLTKGRLNQLPMTPAQQRQRSSVVLSCAFTLLPTKTR